METWDTWAQVRCDSLDLFQISVDCDITGASACGQWVITLIGQVYFNFCPYMVLLTVYSATSLTSTKTLKNQKYTTIWKKKEEFLPFPFLILEEVWTLKYCNPFLSLSQSFSAQRNKSRSHHKNCCKLTTHEVCAPFLCLHDVYSDAKSVFCSTIGQFFKISRRQLLEPVIFYNSWHEEKDRAQNDPDNQFILLQAPSKHGGRNFNYIQKNYAECTQL